MAADDKFIYEYDMVKAGGPLASNLYWFDVNGSVPCCIQAAVPDYQSDAQVPVGKVMGTCDPDSGKASITWRGTVFSQDISNATLLAVSIKAQPGAAMSACPMQECYVPALVL